MAARISKLRTNKGVKRMAARISSPKTNKRAKRTAATISKPRETVIGTSRGNTTLSYDGINEPGAYICRWSGHLLRVPEDSISTERSPRMSVIGADTLLVTKIDSNPFVTVSKARLLAANQDVSVNF